MAWVTADETSETPGPGDTYGTRTFELDGCGSFGGYCDTTEGVDLTIDTAVR